MNDRTAPGAGTISRAAQRVSVGISLAAAFGWATYYLFVLWDTPGTAPSAILFYPFAVGGGAYALWAVASGHGSAFARLWRTPEAYARTALMLAMQLTILAATYLTGAVDASLLSLIGDVVATPLLAAALFAGPRSALRRPPVVAGLLLSLAGGSLAIVGGRRVMGVHGVGWIAVLAAPIAVALYFLLAARASDSVDSSAVVGQTIVGAAIGSLVVAPLVPGGWSGVTHVATVPLALLAANGLISFFVAPALYFLALRREGIVVPPMLMTAIPIFTLALSVGVLGERVPWLGLLGIPIAVVGAILTLRTIAPTAPSEDRWAPSRRIS
ncbi:MAG TPA: DMT family transporter [Thermoplasmata archaeon]|nr:DMT family transporter [Thermoplasmata archaeon]